MARRKTITDSQVLERLFETMMEVGPDNLTFSLAAAGCGLAAATLVQRFGNREALIQAVLSHGWDQLERETRAADAEEAIDAQGAISLLMRLMPPQAAECNATNGLLLLREDFRDPVLRSRGSAWGRYLASALGRRLTIDPDRTQCLGWQMASLWQGAHIWWGFTRSEPADQEIRGLLQAWVQLAIGAGVSGPDQLPEGKQPRN